MKKFGAISSFEIKEDAIVGPTCIVRLARGAQLHFRLCRDVLRKVAQQDGYATKEEFLAACSLAGTELRKLTKLGDRSPLPATARYSVAGAFAHANRIDPREKDE